MLEFPKLALKSLFVDVNLSSLYYFVGINYGVDDVSKCVNIESKRINNAHVNVVSRKYRIVRTLSCERLTSPLGGAVVR